jgi:hypothetical protein
MVYRDYAEVGSDEKRKADTVHVTIALRPKTGFTNLTRAYGLLTTIAGAGGPQDS